MTMYLTPETFALSMPDVSMEVSDWGKFVGADAIRFQFGEMMKEELTGCMFDHYVATPIIEVAGDGKTARAKFDSPGHETQVDGKGGHKAFWCWGSYSAEFIVDSGTYLSHGFRRQHTMLATTTRLGILFFGILSWMSTFLLRFELLGTPPFAVTSLLSLTVHYVTPFRGYRTCPPLTVSHTRFPSTQESLPVFLLCR
jgi:hypothetical protein